MTALADLPDEHHAFLERLFAFQRTQAPASNDLDAFRTHIIAPWDELVGQLRQSVDRALANLTPFQHRMKNALLNAPDLLAPLGYERTETTHTRLVAWFLDQEDDVGTACGHALLQQLQRPVSPLTVREEVLVAPGCRVDLRLRTATDLIDIEAKVDADERASQLDDYRRALESDASQLGLHPVLVFLTIDGREAHSGRPDATLAFEDLLQAWLPLTLRDGPTATYLTSYLASVARNLCELTEARPFDAWSLGRKHRFLAFLAGVAHG